MSIEKREITRKDLDDLEKYADKLFKSVGIDVGFTKHFLERVNDPRNKKQITIDELVRLFREEYAKYGKKIAQMGPDAEAILKDMRTDINIPFVLNWDSKSQELDLSAKTVMRKKDFKSKDREFTVSEDAPVNATGSAIPGTGNSGEAFKSGPMLKRKKFAGYDVFEVKTDVFVRARMQKKKGQHWKSYLEEDEYCSEIREYANKQPKSAIVLQDERSGAMFFARYGKGR